MDFGKKAKESAYSLFCRHIGSFVHLFDPIKSYPIEQSDNHIRKQFYFPVLFLIGSVLYGTLLHQLSTIHSINLAAIGSSPNLYLHQMGPRVIWPIIRWGFGFNTGGAVVVYVVLIATRFVEQNFVYSITKRGGVQIGSKSKVEKLNMFIIDGLPFIKYWAKIHPSKSFELAIEHADSSSLPSSG